MRLVGLPTITAVSMRFIGKFLLTKPERMTIYQRPHSVEIPEQEYLDRYGSPEEAKRRHYNIGAGSWVHPYWTNIDLPAQTPAFAAIQAPCIKHDLVASATLPLETASVDSFYCSH